MKAIPNRQTATLQTSTVTANAIGERVQTWATAATLYGVLDMVSGSDGYTAFKAPIMESTHVFLCDYSAISATATNARLLIDSKVYDVTMIDDPCGLHDHLEIYLNFKGLA